MINLIHYCRALIQCIHTDIIDQLRNNVVLLNFFTIIY